MKTGPIDCTVLTAMEERIPFEWEEYPPENPQNYRCRQCGKRWQDNEVYPDPARKAWTCP